MRRGNKMSSFGAVDAFICCIDATWEDAPAPPSVAQIAFPSLIKLLKWQREAVILRALCVVLPHNCLVQS